MGDDMSDLVSEEELTRIEHARHLLFAPAPEVVRRLCLTIREKNAEIELMRQEMDSLRKWRN